MIDEIEVRNVASIADASIGFSPSMTAITGETGAGKTALLSALKMMMGQRISRDAVKDGTDMAEVSGRLILSGAEAIVEEIAMEYGSDPLGIDISGDENASFDDSCEIVVSRRLSADGRSRVRINGKLASVGELASIVEDRIGLSSQHDQVLLTKPQIQREYLDAWSQIEYDGALDEYKAAFSEALEAARQLKDVQGMAKRSIAEIEDARFALSKIDAISPDPNDYQELLASVRKAENIEMLARTTGEAKSALSSEGGVLDGLNAAIVLIEEASRADDQLLDDASTLRDALYAIEDVARDISTYHSAIDMDESMLGVMQDRIAAYQSLMRSYGPTIEDVIRSAEEARRIIEAVDDSEKAIAAAEKRLDECESMLEKSARKLSEARKQGARTLGSKVTENLSRLHMQEAEFICEVKPLPRQSWNENGSDEIRFKLKPAATMQPRDLSRIASGGELSRTVLALHAALGDRDNVDTFVFDEVDAGVGGEAAESVGELLAELSRSHQVIVITHVAQIASKADKHLVARKEAEGGVIYTTIESVEGGDRVDEVARMLSGTRTQESLAHAEALLSSSKACS